MIAVHKKPKARGRIDLRADPHWSARLRRQAQNAGLSLSDYIRRAVNEQLIRDEAYYSSKG